MKMRLACVLMFGLAGCGKAAEKPADPVPVADKPVADKPVADKPVADKPVADKLPPVPDKPPVPAAPPVLEANQGYVTIDGVETRDMKVIRQEQMMMGMLSLVRAESASQKAVTFSIMFPKGLKAGMYVSDKDSFKKPTHWTINGTIDGKGIGLGEGYHMEATIKADGELLDVTFTGKLVTDDKRLVPVDGHFKAGK